MTTNHNINFEYDENNESYFMFKGFKVFSNSNANNLDPFLTFLDGAPPTAFTRIKHINFDGDMLKVYWVDDINKNGFKSDHEIIGDFIVFKNYVAGINPNGSPCYFKVQNWVKNDEPEELEESEELDKSKPIPMIFDRPFNWDHLPAPKKSKMELPDKFIWPGSSGSKKSVWDDLGK
jgi:hypothetical protein